MNKGHRRTLDAIFTDPVSANIKWRDIESLMKVLGADISERRGSRIGVDLNGLIGVFHRPHPRPDTDKGAVKDVRNFLRNAGVEPEE
jgi:hypothetical protein